ncbi:hypothetical protein Rxyl_0017 [Rubrobacter xylanophilus DSM 9941]|uniref:Uncharacterized protein n=1 Tax=Rubrobacter xylanophilus (strain DSM 9941 / JCM 11954 / NBRC 16129 / PRD-1) TaxID=266117 RepID=Q1B030_RUBXD|nr:hypothetical protein [Rubrobacter xylanophilus]ABG02998.1 hypothetical protein Rxyl_0017 [Rubrobacter xylanophilus DSM 9941]
MGFEEAALTRLRRYREEADRSLGLISEAEERARAFSERLFSGLERVSGLARRAGFEVSAERSEDLLSLRVREVEEAAAAFAVLRGAAAETDEDLMHEELSHYSLDPAGYSGRILGWSPAAGEEPCQIFAVYRDGTWKTKGLFVARSRGRVDDPEEAVHGFCLRIVGGLIDLAALTGGVGRRWDEGPYSLQDRLRGRPYPVRLRIPR